MQNPDFPAKRNPLSNSRVRLLFSGRVTSPFTRGLSGWRQDVIGGSVLGERGRFGRRLEAEVRRVTRQDVQRAPTQSDSHSLARIFPSEALISSLCGTSATVYRSSAAAFLVRGRL